jgi:signal transduction histidine kinase
MQQLIHDLKAPLSNIYTSAELLLDDIAGILDEKQRDFVERIFNNAKKGLSLIEEYAENEPEES